MLAIKCYDNQETYYQISTAYIDEITKLVNNLTSFALVYDRNCCYLYTGTEIYNIGETPLKVSDRSILYSIDEISNNGVVELNSISNTFSFTAPQTNMLSTAIISPFNNAALSSNSIYVGCDVDFVSQNPPSNMCWAASIACIVNHLKGTEYTAVQVAKRYYGNTNYNLTLPLVQIDDILNGTYGLSYTYKDQIPSTGAIMKNLNNNYPICATFQFSSGYHVVVIHGINWLGGYIYIMDPEYGFCSGTSTTTGYKYTSGWSGVQLSFYSAACRYWTE